MSKKEKKDDLIDKWAEQTGGYQDSTVEELKDESPELVKIVEAISKPPQMIMFDRYFMSLGRPMHHKAGMLAFCNTKGKKTVEAWKSLFARY